MDPSLHRSVPYFSSPFRSQTYVSGVRCRHTMGRMKPGRTGDTSRCVVRQVHQHHTQDNVPYIYHQHAMTSMSMNMTSIAEGSKSTPRVRGMSTAAAVCHKRMALSLHDHAPSRSSRCAYLLYFAFSPVGPNSNSRPRPLVIVTFTLGASIGLIMSTGAAAKHVRSELDRLISTAPDIEIQKVRCLQQI